MKSETPLPRRSWRAPAAVVLALAGCAAVALFARSTSGDARSRLRNYVLPEVNQLASANTAYASAPIPSGSAPVALEIAAVETPIEITETIEPEATSDAETPPDEVAGGDALPADTEDRAVLDVAAVALPADQLAAIAADLKDLREEVRKLEASMDEYVNSFVSDLQDENTRLRREIERLYTMQVNPAASGVPDGIALPAPVPQPGNDVLLELRQRALQQLGVDEYPGDPPAPPAPDAAASDSSSSSAPSTLRRGVGIAYEIVREWGLGPDQVNESKGALATLKGMICAVPRTVSDDDMMDLGRRLREEFSAYDNINIEIFDDKAAAQLYAETNAKPEKGRILRIAKHAKNGQDLIILVKDDKSTPVGK